MSGATQTAPPPTHTHPTQPPTPNTPQVPIFDILRKFDAATPSEDVRAGRRRFRITRLPRFLVLHVRRFLKNQVGVAPAGALPWLGGPERGCAPAWLCRGGGAQRGPLSTGPWGRQAGVQQPWLPSLLAHLTAMQNTTVLSICSTAPSPHPTHMTVFP